MKGKNLSPKAKILIMIFLTLIVCAAYLLFALRFSNSRLLHYQIEKRLPKVFAILITAFSDILVMAEYLPIKMTKLDFLIQTAK